MINTVLCLINFYKSKNCINAKNTVLKTFTILLGIILNIISLLSFNILAPEINEKPKIIIGYFIIISIFYFLATVKEKISNLKYVKDLFAFPISCKELFFSIFSYHFLSYDNLIYMHLYFVPIYFLHRSFSNFIVLLLISLLIVITVELLVIFLCELSTSLLYSNFLTVVCILISALIIYVVYIFYNSILEQFTYMFFSRPRILLIILAILIFLLYQISKYLFLIYSLILKNDNGVI